MIKERQLQVLTGLLSKDSRKHEIDAERAGKSVRLGEVGAYVGKTSRATRLALTGLQLYTRMLALGSSRGFVAYGILHKGRMGGMILDFVYTKYHRRQLYLQHKYGCTASVSRRATSHTLNIETYKPCRRL